MANPYGRIPAPHQHSDLFGDIWSMLKPTVAQMATRGNRMLGRTAGGQQFDPYSETQGFDPRLDDPTKNVEGMFDITGLLHGGVGSLPSKPAGALTAGANAPQMSAQLKEAVEAAMNGVDVNQAAAAFGVTTDAIHGALWGPAPKPKANPNPGTLRVGDLYRAMDDAPEQFGEFSNVALGGFAGEGFHGSRYNQPLWTDPYHQGPGPWVSTDPRISNTYNDIKGVDQARLKKMAPMSMPMAGAFRNALHVNAMGNPWDSIPLKGMMGGKKFQSNMSLSTDDFADLAKQGGFDGVVFSNVIDDVLGESKIPSTVFHALKRNTIYSPITGERLYSGGGFPVMPGVTMQGQQQQ